MTNKEAIKHLKDREKNLFDTYKNRSDYDSKIKHLKQMILVMEEIQKLENDKGPVLKSVKKTK